MRVLVVEDHGDSRNAMISLLERWGFEVSAAAADYHSAIEFIQTKPFDVLLSDIGLPDGTGFTVMQEAKRHQPNIVGIAVSAFHSPLELQLAERVGFDHYIQKPLDAQRLHTILDKIAA